MLYVSGRSTIGYLVTDTSDNTTEPVSFEDLETLVVKAGIKVYGVMFEILRDGSYVMRVRVVTFEELSLMTAYATITPADNSFICVTDSIFKVRYYTESRRYDNKFVARKGGWFRPVNYDFINSISFDNSCRIFKGEKETFYEELGVFHLGNDGIHCARMANHSYTDDNSELPAFVPRMYFSSKAIKAEDISSTELIYGVQALEYINIDNLVSNNSFIKIPLNLHYIADSNYDSCGWGISYVSLMADMRVSVAHYANHCKVTKLKSGNESVRNLKSISVDPSNGFDYIIRVIKLDDLIKQIRCGTIDLVGVSLNDNLLSLDLLDGNYVIDLAKISKDLTKDSMRSKTMVKLSANTTVSYDMNSAGELLSITVPPNGNLIIPNGTKEISITSVDVSNVNEDKLYIEFPNGIEKFYTTNGKVTQGQYTFKGTGFDRSRLTNVTFKGDLSTEELHHAINYLVAGSLMLKEHGIAHILLNENNYKEYAEMAIDEKRLWILNNSGVGTKVDYFEKAICERRNIVANNNPLSLTNVLDEIIAYLIQYGNADYNQYLIKKLYALETRAVKSRVYFKQKAVVPTGLERWCAWSRNVDVSDRPNYIMTFLNFKSSDLSNIINILHIRCLYHKFNALLLKHYDMPEAKHILDNVKRYDEYYINLQLDLYEKYKNNIRESRW